MKRITISAIAMLAIASLVFAAGGKETAVAGEKALTITMATGDVSGGVLTLMGERMKAEVEKDPALKISINFIEGPVLGTASQIMDQVVEGSVQIFINDLAWIAPYDPDFQPMSFGFMFRDSEHMMKYFASPTFKAVVDKVAANSNLRLIAPVPLASRMFFSVKPLNTIDDFKGLKLRAPGLEMFVKSYEAYGTSPTTVAWNEIFLGLKTKLVEAAHGLLSDVYANKWHLAAPYITRTDDMFGAKAWYVNESFWKKLDAKQRDGLMKAFEEANAWVLEQATKIDKDIIASMVSEGAIYSDSFKDREILRSQAIAAVKKLELTGKWSRGLVAQIDAIK